MSLGDSLPISTPTLIIVGLIIVILIMYFTGMFTKEPFDAQHKKELDEVDQLIQDIREAQAVLDD